MNPNLSINELNIAGLAPGDTKEISLVEHGAFLLPLKAMAKVWIRFFAVLALRILILLAILSMTLFFYIVYLLPLIKNLEPLFQPETSASIIAGSELEKENGVLKQKLEKNLKSHQKILMAKAPRSAYLVINTTENKFFLRKGNETLRTGFCSTGSLTVLKKSDQEKWAFQTPRGTHIVRSKTTNPVWKKPDWAFVEEGLPIPSANHSSRFDYATLGDYALNLGDGYLIHGTLYQRLLGMPVTHGCIRLGDDDLEYVYQSLEPGAKVFIY